jgi:threonine synthase
MTMCPRCGSTFLQPLRCEAKGSDVVVVELRCPDCMTWLKAPHTRADMRELDRRQAEYRAEIVTQYERMVTESMEALAACLATALALDLVSADDFAPRLGGDGRRQRTVGA